LLKKGKEREARMKKVLFVQSEHTFAKLSQNLEFADILSENGYEVVFAVSKRGSKFLANNSRYRCEIIPQLWERQPKTFFFTAWFEDKQYIESVFRRELDLMRREKPDLVISNMSFTARLSCREIGIPLISILPPIQSPSKMVLSTIYNRESFEPEVREKILAITDQWETAWWQNLAVPFADLLEQCKHEPITDLRSLLVGDFQLVHSAPEYDKVGKGSYSYAYTGPLTWRGWKNPETLVKNLNNVVLCTFGTKVKPELNLVKKTIEAVQHLKDDYFVIHIGAATELQRQYSHIKNVLFIDSYNPEILLPACKAVFCHSGYSMVLLCLKYGVPLLTVPFQLEEGYHTKKLEQIGAGLCLTSIPKTGQLLKSKMNEDIFMSSVEQLTSEKIYNGLSKVISNHKYRQAAQIFSEHIKNMPGCKIILRVVESQPWLPNKLNEVDI
jgi:UDP:flavonoid glycosyltransferase YjiC (YdhE family)